MIKKFFSKNGNVKPWIIIVLFCILYIKKIIVSHIHYYLQITD